MSIYRRVAKADANQQTVMEALRAIGALVWYIREPADLLVGFRKQWFILEVKNPNSKRGRSRTESTTPAQMAFFQVCDANGLKWDVVYTPEEALQSIGCQLSFPKEQA